MGIGRGNKSSLFTSSSNGGDVTWAVNPTPGDTVLVAVWTTTAETVSSVKDNGTSQTTFTADVTKTASPLVCTIYRGNNITLPSSGSYKVTVTASGGANVVAGGVAYTGVKAGAPTATNTGTNTGTPVSTGTALPAQTGALFFAAFASDSGLNPETITPTGTFTSQFTQTNGASFICGGVSDKIDPAGPAATAATWTLGDSILWAGVVAVYDSAPQASMPAQPGGRTWRRRNRRRQAWPAVGTPPVIGAGATSLNLAMAGTGYQSLPFPQVPLGIKVELLINGTWTDISQFVYQRADMVITTGRPDESQQLQQSSCTFTLNNRDFRFSPYNTSGAYSPFLTRNTQCRVSVLALSAGGTLYSGYRFWGEVPAWPPVWDTTGTDVTAVVTVSGIMRRLTANTRNIGSALYRYWTRLGGAGAPVAYWPCEDASNATSFASAVSGGTAMTWTGTPALAADSSIAGSDPFPQLNGSVWIGSVSGSATPSPAVYTSPGTHLWTAPGDVTSVLVECVGSGAGAGGNNPESGYGGGGGGAYASATVTVVPGTTYTLVVPAGGQAGDDSDGTNGASATFGGTTVVAAGGRAAAGATPGHGGQSSACTGTTRHSGGDGGTAFGTPSGGAGGGGSGGSSSSGNGGNNNSGSSGGSGGSAVSGGGPGGHGGNSGANGKTPVGPGGGGGGGGDSGTTATTGGNGAPGQVKLTYTSTGAPAANVLRFVLDVPAAGGTNGAILAEMSTSGTITTVDVTYGTGGTLTVTGYNVSHVSKFTHTSAAICNGVPMLVSVALTTSGTAVAWSFDYMKPGDAAGTNISSGSVAASSVGGVVEFDGNVGGTEVTAAGLGQVVIQYAVTALDSDTGMALAAYNGEHAADRLDRLCTEQGIGFDLTGNDFDTAQMGPQTDAPIVQLLQECEDADKGLLFELIQEFGLGYRTRVDMQNQAAGATLDYNAFQIGETVPQPVDDELLVVNDITLTRANGSSFEATLMTGALSVLDPPNGVGYYSQGFTYNLHADSQLANAAAWALAVGTVDEFRWPVIEANLANPRNAGTSFAALPSLVIGDFLEMVNPPPFVQAGTVKQLVFGYTETLNAHAVWRFDFNCVPESPYEGAGLPAW